MKILNKNILLIVLMVLSISSCSTSPEDVNNAKKDMGIIEDSIPVTEIVNDNIQQTEKLQNKNIKIEYLTKEKFLELDFLNYISFVNGEAEISGSTLEKVDKIVVTFSNTTSSFPEDIFELKQFKPGDKTFVYRAHTIYKVLDFGVNEYIFTAYVGDKISKLKLTVDVKKENELHKENIKEEVENKTEESKEVENKTEESKEVESVVYDKINLDDKDIILSLPTGGSFGHPISLGENGFTYSDISGLEINKASFSTEVKCDKITEYLKEKIGTWFYWNTCRNILATKKSEKSKGISIFVIRLDGESYYYEKHFLLFEKGLYGTYEIEKGENIDKENISEKNSELKEKNSEILNIEVVNNLFKEILK